MRNLDGLIYLKLGFNTKKRKSILEPARNDTIVHAQIVPFLCEKNNGSTGQVPKEISTDYHTKSTASRKWSRRALV